MAAHQASPSLGFSRQEHWSGLPFPSPMHESEKWKGSCSVMSDPQRSMDCSLPGSSIHGIFQARVLGWGAIAFSGVDSRGIKKNTQKTEAHRHLFNLITTGVSWFPWEKLRWSNEKGKQIFKGYTTEASSGNGNRHFSYSKIIME